MHSAPAQSTLATSTDVAKRAGVSRTTVSAILNGHGARFPKVTHEKVKQAAADLNYRPSVAGRSLVSGRSDTIILFLPNSTFGAHLQDSTDRIVDGVEGYIGNVVIRFAGKDMQRSLADIEAMRPLAVVNFGVLLDDTDYSRLEQSGIVLFPSSEEQTKFKYSDGGVAALQLDAVSKSADRDVWYACISDSRTDAFGPNRFRALNEECAKRNLAKPRIVSVNPSGKPAISALKEVTAESKTANILCYNDDVALSLLAAARDLKVEVPGAFSVVGVDNTFAGQLWSPRLTTIDSDTKSFAAYISSQLKALLTNEPQSSLPYTHHMSIVLGETTK
jgi:Transcriptional regulators